MELAKLGSLARDGRENTGINLASISWLMLVKGKSVNMEAKGVVSAIDRVVFGVIIMSTGKSLPIGICRKGFGDTN